ncbi:MAG TPA: mucoidy inhibitor MuiA family protein [Gammaproteobacteria bacterium]|nr:mucoidy inhibitor MuiA family protein [Gammaproteobacteria bacterium]
MSAFSVLAKTLITVLILWPAIAAATLEVDSRISAVTLYPDRAQVTRTLSVELPAGDSRIVVSGLPATLADNALRVAGHGKVALTLGPVQSRRVFLGALAQQEEQRLQNELTALEDKKRAAGDRIKALRQQLAFIEALGKTAPATISEDLRRNQLEPARWKAAWTQIGTGASDSYRRIQEEEIQIRDLLKKITKIKNTLQGIHTGQRQSKQVQFDVHADQAGPARFELSYQLPGASWTPVYEARLDAAGGAVTLIQRAAVRQRTGEDWIDVTLRLSTARPAFQASLPELPPWTIDLRPPAAALFDSEQTMPRSRALMQQLASPMAERPRAKMKDERDAAPESAQIAGAEFATEYLIPGRATVPADNEPHYFTVHQEPLAATLAALSIPKLDPAAYLYAELRYPGAAPLLPGPVSVFRDNVFVGNARLPLIRPGERVKLSFGKDDKLKVRYHIDAAVSSPGGIFNRNKKLERGYRITITNHHQRAMDITVLDQLPVPQDKRITVKLDEKNTSPVSQYDVDGKQGVLAWRKNYLAGEKNEIRFVYSVAYPAELALQGL